VTEAYEGPGTGHRAQRGTEGHGVRGAGCGAQGTGSERML
jgi:hypothetical protein